MSGGDYPIPRNFSITNLGTGLPAAERHGEKKKRYKWQKLTNNLLKQMRYYYLLLLGYLFWDEEGNEYAARYQTSRPSWLFF